MITPSCSGLTAVIDSGVRPSICRASLPTAVPRPSTLRVPFSRATTEGSSSTIPRPWTATSVLAVPRSIARSGQSQRRSRFSILAPADTNVELTGSYGPGNVSKSANRGREDERSSILDLAVQSFPANVARDDQEGQEVVQTVRQNRG